MRTKTVLSLGLLGLFTVACGACGEEGGTIQPPVGWDYVWSDEFDGDAGTIPNPDNWQFDVGGGGWGNGQLEYNTDRPENASHDGRGNLVITARRESFDGNAYTSARIKSMGLFEQKYGLFEARIRLPIGQGIWPAFWMLGNDIEDEGVEWPETGEIDIMEFKGQDPTQIFGSLHGPGYSAGAAISARSGLPDDGRFNEDFHVFAVEWDPGRIAWSVDGEVYSIVTTGEVTARGEWVFDHPFFMLLNLAVGGGYVGDPDASTTFPQTMLVDYVRVFERRL